MKPRSLVLLLLIMLFGLSNAQYFGKNKVHYKNFKWFFIQSTHFDVYFYPGGEKLAEFVAETAENAYKQLKRDFAYELRERVVIIVYKSHNDWQQTNVVISYLEEGVGGVTELYKNRVVVPFEGLYDQFRHVIHHELVHAMVNDMLYGGNINSLIMGQVAPLPLWANEGLAEFESVGWNTKTDMIVRDAVLTGYIPPVQYLQYILAYQGGNSVYRYIAETYGREKIGEILHKARGKVGFQQVLKSAIGLDYKELTKRWHRYLRKKYYPEVANRQVPSEFSEQMTDHEKWKNYLNVSPTITPQGDKIAYISDRSGYQNIYLKSAIDGKELKTLVKGQRSESFEELHFLRPGMSFSPDGTQLVFAAKSGPWDALYIVDVKSGKIKKYLTHLDGAFTTSWSPDGEKIAFVGNKDGQSDIYIYNLKEGTVQPVTNDIFTDDQPSWSPDSRYLAFVSDRGDYLSQDQIPADFDMARHDFEDRDIYIVDLQSGKIQRKTNTVWEEDFPIFSPDGRKLAFTSDENGIFNLYIENLETGEYHAVTNTISGIFQINWDKTASKLVYSTFYHGGYDIYVIDSPLELKPVQLKNTEFVNEMRSGQLPVYAVNWQPPAETEKGAEKESGKKAEKKAQKPPKLEGAQPVDLSHYVFGKYQPRNKRKSPREIEIPEEKSRDESGKYKVRKYKIKFSPDYVTGAAGYNTFFGLQGYTALAFSDLLGDHQIFLTTNLWADLRNSDFALQYYYLKRRLNIGVGGYHLVYLFNDYWYGFMRYENFGGVITASYPFNRYNRLDMSLLSFNVALEYLDFPIPTDRVNTVIPEASYTHDNVLWGLRWGILAPVSGSRYKFTLRASPDIGKNSRDFRTLEFDYRKYFMLSPKYQFAVRMTAGASFGRNSQQYFLGGVDNWINRKFNGDLRIQRIDDVFFSQFITPLRGAYYYSRIGNRFFLTNLEFRFPLIEYLKLGFPPISLFNIRGNLFLDVGSAWYNQGDWYSLSSFRGTYQNSRGQTAFRDLAAGYGIGARVYFIGFLLRYDLAWPLDYDRSGKPIHYISLGLDF